MGILVVKQVVEATSGWWIVVLLFQEVVLSKRRLCRSAFGS